MIPYIFVIILFLFLSAREKINSRFLELVILFYIAIFMCGGYMCGSDWRTYEKDYYDVHSVKDVILEPGYFLLTVVAKSIGFDFWTFTILLKFLCLIIVHKVFLEYIVDNKYIAMLFYFSFYGLFLFVDAPMRNLCAIALFSLSLMEYEKSKIKAFLICGMGLLFHASAVIGILFLLLKNVRIKTYVYVFMYLGALYLSFKGTMFAEMVNNTLLGQLLFAEKLNRYVENGFGGDANVSSPTSMGEMLRTALFFLILSFRKRIEALEKGQEIFYGAMFFFIIGKIGASMEVLMRFGCYFAMFYAISLSDLIKVITVRFKSIYRIALVSLAIMQTIATITFDYRFVPYTNYFSYLLFHDQMPSYNIRSDYNLKNSPYNNKK